MRAGRVIAAVAVAALVGGACSSGGGGGSDQQAERSRTAPESSDAATTTRPPPSAPADAAAAEAEVRAAYEKYFDSNTPQEEAVALAAEIDEILPTLLQAQAVAPGGHRTVAVTKVAFTGAEAATVTFDILYDGNPLLFGFVGTAVVEDGVWKISRKTNCDLTALAGFACP